MTDSTADKDKAIERVEAKIDDLSNEIQQANPDAVKLPSKADAMDLAETFEVATNGKGDFFKRMDEVSKKMGDYAWKKLGPIKNAIGSAEPDTAMLEFMLMGVRVATEAMMAMSARLDTVATYPGNTPKPDVPKSKQKVTRQRKVVKGSELQGMKAKAGIFSRVADLMENITSGVSAEQRRKDKMDWEMAFSNTRTSSRAPSSATQNRGKGR